MSLELSKFILVCFFFFFFLGLYCFAWHNNFVTDRYLDQVLIHLSFELTSKDIPVVSDKNLLLDW